MPIHDKDKKRDYAREWVTKRRKAFFCDKRCVICNSSSDLELDHINPAEKESHSIWSWSEKRRLVELAKCQVLCKKCHQKKTIKENKDRWESRPIIHGTIAAYYRRHCRCSDCLIFMNAYRKTIKSRNPSITSNSADIHRGTGGS